MFILRIFISLILILNANNSLASWGAITSFFCTNPIGAEREEKWNKEYFNRGSLNNLCPPYNKTAGRDIESCLLKKDYPGIFSAYYSNICAEETHQSNYFAPKIRVRGQQCNAFACWATSNNLTDGECAILVSSYVLPLHRMCARIAVPADPIRGISADPGYTQGKHLDFIGAEKDDKAVQLADGMQKIFDMPKLCLYKDDSLFESILKPHTGLDLMDINPIRQPYHNSGGVHPVAKVIIFVVKFINDGASGIGDILASIIGEIPGIGELGSTALEFLATLIGWFGDGIVSLIEEIGQFNRKVDNDIYGCVNLPLGPFPPPFCPTLSELRSIATTQKICPLSSTSSIESTEGNECVVSELGNNFINNSVRVGYDNFIPLCRNGEDSNETDKCISINNLELAPSAQNLHIYTGKTDIIKDCKNDNSGAVCVQSNCADNCPERYRIIYGAKIKDKLIPKQYFYSNLPDCSTSSTLCQVIWGVNSGDFTDVSIRFPEIQTSAEGLIDMPKCSDSSNSPCYFDLKDKDESIKRFHTSIVRNTSYDSTNEFMQDPNHICVFESEKLVGCQERIPPPSPKIYNCNEKNINCYSDYFAPAFIASYEVDNDSTSVVVRPKSLHDLNNSTSQVNLAGQVFSSFITDDSFTTMPFSGKNSPNPASLFGQYQNDESPVIKDVNNQFKENENAVYQKNLEYINGEYYLGGKYACLHNDSISRCPEDKTMCVLSNLKNKDIVECSKFFEKVKQYFGMNNCSSDEIINCTIIDSMQGRNGDSINIRQCESSLACYEFDEELCIISRKKEDRYKPSPDIEILTKDDYYDPTTSSSNGDSGSIPRPTGFSMKSEDIDEYRLRSKTSIEMGLCTQIPLGICQKRDNPLEEDGFASWSEAKVGEISIGICGSGYRKIDDDIPLERYCVPDPNTKSFKLESLTNERQNARCVKIESEIE